MATVTFTKINSFVGNMALGLLNLNGTPTVALTNTAHTSTWDELADLTEISYTNLSTRVLTVTTASQTGGTFTFDCDDLVLTASDTVPEFRYIYIYDDNSAGDKLVCYGDYGSAVNLAPTNMLTIEFNASGVLTIA